MSELDRPIGRVWRRMRFQRFLSALIWTWAAALGLVAITIAVEKVGGFRIPAPSWIPFVLVGGLGIVVALLIAVVSGPSRLDAAVAIDRSFHLHERLSTALTLPADLRETSAGRAVLSDTMAQLAALDVRSAFSPALPRRAWVALIPAALAMALVLIPWDPSTTAQARSMKGRDTKALMEQTKALGKKIASQRKEIEKTKFPEADKLLAQIEKLTEELAKAPPAGKDKALIELNKMTDALKDRQKQLGSPEQINRQLAQLKDIANQGPADQFAKNLAKGDFLKAANELKRLQEKLKSGKLTEAEKTTLKEQLGEMSKQLQKLANLEERKKQLEEAKKQGGLSQRQFEQEMAKLNEQAKNLQKLSQMAAKLGEAQEALQKGDMKKAAQSLGMSEKQLSEMARNLQELQALDGALADLQDTKNGMTGDGMNMLGEAVDGNLLGSGQRGNSQNTMNRGQGQGDRAEAPDKTSQYTTRVKQQFGKGKAIADGTAPPNTPVKGRSFIDVQGEMATVTGNAADALSNQKVPRNIEKHVRGYFDQINKGK
ncbi:MAG: hypothetical protein NVSMB9_34100 [Isosphaeraceae bacterium]